MHTEMDSLSKRYFKIVTLTRTNDDDGQTWIMNSSISLMNVNQRKTIVQLQPLGSYDR